MRTSWKCLLNSITCFLLLLAFFPAMNSLAKNVKAKPAFQGKPKVIKKKKKTKLTFSVTKYCDVEIAVLNSKNKIVRHLAAGLLGPNAPKPFKKNSLKQSIIWNGLDDNGKKATGSPFQFRARINSKAILEKYIGWDGHAAHNEQIIEAVRIGKKGELYVLFSEETWGRPELRVFNTDGSYKKTLIPLPVNLPQKRLKGIKQLTINSKKIPMVYNGHSGTFMPLTSGFKKQDMPIDANGNLILTSAVGTLSNHGPMRHLLAIHPDGGAPENMGFVGPELMKPRGFLGGSGESADRWFDGMAVSPDNKYIYLTMTTNGWSMKDKLGQGVYRLKWTDKKLGPLFIGGAKRGKSKNQFCDPKGLTVDKKGNLYICDFGNNRVVKYSPLGKLIASFPVKSPRRIAIHNKTKNIYILSRQAGRPFDKPASAVIKFSPWKGSKPPKEIARLKGSKNCFQLMALDPNSQPAKIWVSQYGGWHSPDQLSLITDSGTSLSKGKNILNKEGIGYPMFTSVDARNGKLYVTNFREQVRVLDLKTGKVIDKISGTNEIVVDKEGNRYSMHGWALLMRKASKTGGIIKFCKGKDKLGPWELESKEQDGTVAVARSKGPSVGDRGYCFAPDGNMYVIKMAHYGAGRVDIQKPDGTMVKKGIIRNLTWGSSGITVDAKGNIYIGINVRPEQGGGFYSQTFKGQVSEDKWYGWGKAPRAQHLTYPYFNTYLFHWGKVAKFSPKGGRFWEWKPGEKPKGIPKSAKIFRSGYLSKMIAVDGAEWIKGNCGPIPTTGEMWGDPSCSCWNSRLSGDAYGRVYSPDVFNFGVYMMDTNGNFIQEIGEYGNADEKKKIAFSWPAYIAYAGEKIYVADSGNNRIAIIKLKYSDTVDCKIPK